MSWTTLLSVVLLGVEFATAVPNPQEPSPTLTLSTAVASPSTDPASSLPSQVPFPPTQPWCPSEIFCAGPVSYPALFSHDVGCDAVNLSAYLQQLLQTINVANLYSDEKTFVDKPTNKPSGQVLTDFAAINGTNPTYGQVEQFVDADFSGEGLELEAVALPNFNQNPAFLNGIKDPLVKAWSSIVHGYWAQLIRNTNESTLCDGVTCESSLIPLNHTFVIPGGRFRENCEYRDPAIPGAALTYGTQTIGTVSGSSKASSSPNSTT